MSTQVVNKVVKEVVDIIVVSHRAAADNHVSLWEKAKIAKEGLDLIKYIKGLDEVVQEWRVMQSTDKTDVFLKMNTQLAAHDIYSEDLEADIDAVINWMEATVKLIRRGKAFKSRSQSK